MTRKRHWKNTVQTPCAVAGTSSTRRRSAARSAVKSLLALAALGCLSLAAQAQSVQIYGRVVAGIDFQNNVLQPNGSSGHLWRVDGNQWGTSMFGLRGNEDLGGGLSAFFLLESGFDTTTGTTNGAAFWNRRSYVGLRSPTWGSVQLGKDLSISNDVYFLDPTGQQFMGTATLVNGRNWQGADNIVAYTTPNLGGFIASVQTSLGEQSSGLSALRKDAISAVYTAPSYELRLIYDASRDANGKYTSVYDKSKEFIVGGTVQLGDAKLYGGYEKISAPDTATTLPDKVSQTWVGVNYQAAPLLTLIGAVFRTNVNRGGGNGTLYMVGANYNLSKRTLLYASLGQVHNSSTAQFSVEATNNRPAVGQSQTGTYAGIAHSF